MISKKHTHFCPVTRWLYFIFFFLIYFYHRTRLAPKNTPTFFSLSFRIDFFNLFLTFIILMFFFLNYFLLVYLKVYEVSWWRLFCKSLRTVSRHTACHSMCVLNGTYRRFRFLHLLLFHPEMKKKKLQHHPGRIDWNKIYIK